MNKKGFTYIEVLVSVAIFSILALAMAEFSSNAFNVMYRQGQQTEMADQTRFATDLIPGILNKADYIFPAGKIINISGSNLHTTAINTNNSIAVLISDNDSTPKYYFKAFYLVSKANGLSNLYEFSSSDKFNWTANTCPSSDIMTVAGIENLIATDIDENQSSLIYSVNYNNGITDSILKGEISGATSGDNFALIKGITWNLAFNKAKLEVIKIEGISNNVPRFL